MLRRAAALAALLVSTLTLTGCFVVATSVPAGTGPINDPRLEGTWRGVPIDGAPIADAFFHFQRYDDKKPLRLVWAQGKDLFIYEFLTRRVGKRDVFAATLVGPAEHLAKMRPDEPRGHFLGFYEVKRDRAIFHLLDGQKVGALIAGRKLNGMPPKSKYDGATLTGSPAELAVFLASPDAGAARMKNSPTVRRLTAPAK